MEQNPEVSSLLANYQLPNQFEERMEVVLELLSIGVSAGSACARAGVRRKDFDFVLKHYETWEDRILEAKAAAIQKHIERIGQAGGTQTKRRRIVSPMGETIIEDEIPGDWKADAWMAERLDRENYGNINTNVNVNAEISVLIKDTVGNIAARIENAKIEEVQDAEYVDIQEG